MSKLQNAPVREFQYSPRDFDRVRTMLYKHTGISLSDSKDQLVYSRLARRLRALGMKRFDEYLDALSPDGEEWQAFLNALTTNLTSFFREAHHFDLLADYIKKMPGSSPLRIWCSACSTGEEAYSIAITVCKNLDLQKRRVEIIASDIDTQVLATAEAGIYAIDRVEQLEPSMLQRFFQRGNGKNDGLVRVRPEIRQMISFRQVNLLGEQWPVQGPLDIIFCRNVMIYFDKPTQKKIVERFHPLLKPEGRLFVGHSENLAAISRAFDLMGKTVYKPASRIP